MALFRREAVEARKSKLYGEVIIPTSLPYAAICSLIIIILVLGVVLGLSGTYARSEKVSGQVVSTKGQVRVTPPKAGFLEYLLVSEGDQVEKNQALASVKTENISVDGRRPHENLLTTISKKTKLLRRRSVLEQQQRDADIEELKGEARLAASALEALEERAKLQTEIVASAKKTYDDSGSLRQNGHISSIEFESRKQLFLRAKLQVETIKQELLEIRKLLENLDHEQEHLSLDTEKKLSDFTSEILSLELERTKILNDYQYEILSDTAGTVTSISVVEGSAVTVAQTILTIEPFGGELEVELYVPSKSIPFLRNGQTVEFSYEAFPHQQYGKVVSTIKSITNTMLLPDELGSGYPINEPVYRVTSTLTQDYILFHNQRLKLKPGMRVNAAIILDKVSFLDWLFQSVTSPGAAS